ncbi:MAG: lipid II flippase MurJ, partial [Mycobacteriales bacterium]
ARAARGEETSYAETASRSLSAVLVATMGAAVVLVAVAAPTARLLVAGAPGPERVQSLAHATAVFAPGLVGYGLLALVSRALYARGDGRTPAIATVAGWSVVVVADLALVAAAPDVDRVVALGIGNSIGMTAAGVLLLIGLHRASPLSLSGLRRSSVAGGTAAASAGVVAWLLPSLGSSLPASAGTLVLVGAVTVLVYLAVVRLLHPAALTALIRA